MNLTQQEIIRQIEELELWQGVPQGSLKQRIHTPLDLEQLGLLQTKHQIINIGVPFHYKDHFDVIRCHLISVGISSVEIRRYDDCHMSDDCLVPAMWFSTLVEWYIVFSYGCPCNIIQYNIMHVHVLPKNVHTKDSQGINCDDFREKWLHYNGTAMYWYGRNSIEKCCFIRIEIP